jgi:hypothetical protein
MWAELLRRLLYELMKEQVFAAERIHGDDTTVPILVKARDQTGRIWTHVGDDPRAGLELSAL